MVMKTRYILFTACVLALTVFACTKDEEPAFTDELVTLEATIGEPGTRIHFTGDYGTFTGAEWEAGDCIWVHSNTQPVWERGDRFTTGAGDISSDGHSAKFTGRTRADGKICAVYPYDLVDGTSDNEQICLNIPDTQNIISGDCPKSLMPAAAFWADGSTSFAMKYVLGALKLSLGGENLQVSYFELTDVNMSSMLYGTYVITPDYDAKDIKSMVMKGKAYSNKIRLEPAAAITLGSTPFEFYVMLPEGSLSGGFILKAFDSEDNLIASLSTSSDNTIVRGKVRKMPAASMVAGGPEPVTLEGSGTESDPYKVNSPDALALVSSKLGSDEYEDYAGKYYLQTEDINMAGVDFVPVGQNSGKPFTGHYDGAGKTISNLVTQGTSSDSPASGIFGYTDGAVISGIKAVNRGNTGSYVRVGGIVGHAVNTTISSCSLSGGELAASANICAGIVAQMDGGTVEDCTVSDVTISTSTNYAAGIAAHLPSGGTIQNCHVVNATISGVAENGGICGKIVGGAVKGCSFVSSSITGTGEDIGGIAGWTKPETVFENCTVSDARISSAKNYVAGIVALPEGASIIDCTVNQNTVIEGLGGLGGVAGFLKNTASTIERCIVDGITITGTETNIGGIVGRFDLGEVKACRVSNSTFTGVDSIGGIAGRPITRGGDCIIDACIAEKCTISGTCYLGGIAGYIYPDSNYLLTLANCGARSMTIKSSQIDSRMGGIVGWLRLTDANSNARILNCYALSASGSPLSFTFPDNAVSPAVGGIIGYASMNASSPGIMLIAGCASNLAKANVNGGSVPSDTEAACIGALFGTVGDNAAATVKDCAYVNDAGLSAGLIGAGVTVSGIDGYPAADFASSAVAKLNAFTSSFSDYTLKGWTVTDGLPVIE